MVVEDDHLDTLCFGCITFFICFFRLIKFNRPFVTIFVYNSDDYFTIHVMTSTQDHVAIRKHFVMKIQSQ